MLMHSLMYSKSKVGHYRIIEGLAVEAATATANPAEIAALKQQIAALEATAIKLNTAMVNNEAGVKNNTDLVQKVVKSQNDTQVKMASMKSAQ